MLVKALVLKTTRYQEKSLIVKCYTLSQGLKTYFIPSAYSSQKNNNKIGFFQTLNQLEITETPSKKSNFNYIKEVKLSYNYNTIYQNIYKSTILLFLSEILVQVIKEEEKNERLFTYIETSLMWLDNHDKISNFHLIFLLDLTKFLGFYPETSSISENYFDLQEGKFFSNKTNTTLNTEESVLLKKLFQLQFSENKLIFSHTERQNLLQLIIQFYKIHIQDFKLPKSLEILQEVFQ